MFVRKNVALVVAGVSGLLASAGAFAQAVTVPSAVTQIEAITTGQAGYSTAMFALALTAVGILVGVKWIKRGKGAA